MIRVYAGQTISETFPVTTGGEFQSTVLDALGDEIDSSVTESGGTATLTVNHGSWGELRTGYGRIEIARTDAGARSVQIAERFRILPGIGATQSTGYA